MNLTKKHRQTLVDDLEETNTKIETTQAHARRSERDSQKNIVEEMRDYYNVKLFLLEIRRNAIKKALIEDYMDI